MRGRAVLPWLFGGALAACAEDAPAHRQWIVVVDTDAVVLDARGPTLSNAAVIDTVRVDLLDAQNVVQDVRELAVAWVVAVSTDAPIPQLGDRVLAELLDANGGLACRGCQRLFGAQDPLRWPLSFGIPDAGREGIALRVRLFRADHGDVGGSPGDGPTIDVVTALPPTGGAVRTVHVRLFGACAGVAADPARRLSCIPGAEALGVVDLDQADLAVGSFAPSASTPCARAPKPGMICIEGGLYARGNVPFGASAPATSRPVPERLVRVSPFALDAHEITVGEWRKLGVAPPRPNSSRDPGCTFTVEPGAHEDFPVSCVGRALAAEACAVQGKRLPTEAEWEFAAGNRVDESRFPWGDDPDACTYAAVGLGRDSFERPESSLLEVTACRRQASGTLPWGVRAVATSRDVSKLGIADLGGNLSEWVADGFESYALACGAVVDGVLVDPRCDPAAGSPLARGGNWTTPPGFAAAFTRMPFSDANESPQVGVRCAESLAP